MSPESLQESITLVAPEPGGGTLMRPYEGVASALEMLRVMCAMRFAATHVGAREADSQVLGQPALLTLRSRLHRTFAQNRKVGTLRFLNMAPGRRCVCVAHRPRPCSPLRSVRPITIFPTRTRVGTGGCIPCRMRSAQLFINITTPRAMTPVAVHRMEVTVSSNRYFAANALRT